MATATFESLESIIDEYVNDSSPIPHTITQKTPFTDQLLNMLGTPEISQEECTEHDFQFYDLMGTFCTKCNLPFGVECLHPDCKEHNCERHMLSFDVFTEQSYSDVANEMTNDIAVVHLAHDGVGCNCDKDVEGLRRMLSFPNLVRVEYCGYYSPGYFCGIIGEDQYKHIEFVGIF